MWRQHHPIFIRFDTIPACDRQTDRNATANTTLSIAVHHKNLQSKCHTALMDSKVLPEGRQGAMPYKNVWQHFRLKFRFMIREILSQRPMQISLWKMPQLCPKMQLLWTRYALQIFWTTRKGNHSSFWHQQWLISDAPFGLKFALKVTHLPSKNADCDRFSLSPIYTSSRKITVLEHASRGLSAIARATCSVLPQSACDLLKVL